MTIPTGVHHAAQLITRFLMLKEQGWDVEIADRSRDSSVPFFGLPAVLAEYRGKKLFYDVWDGYQDPDNMKLGLEYCNFYFRRSFSEEKTGSCSRLTGSGCIRWGSITM